MNEALKQKYKERSDKFKIYLSENTTASVLRKYRLIENKKCMEMQNNATKNQQNLLTKKRLDQYIHSFFEIDEISRMTRGIEQTITISKMKILKRLLTASLQELYNRYIIDKKK